MLSRRIFLGSAAASATVASVPNVFASQSNFDMKQFANEVAELVSIDSPSGHEIGVNKVIDIFAKRFESIGWHVSKHHCDGRGNALVATNRKSPDVYDVVLCAQPIPSNRSEMPRNIHSVWREPEPTAPASEMTKVLSMRFGGSAKTSPSL